MLRRLLAADRLPLVPWLVAGGLAISAGHLLVPGYPLGDDNSSHLALIGWLSDGLRDGELRLWCPNGNLGFPVGYYYGFLPHLVMALLHAGTGGAVPLVVLFKLSLVALYASLPIGFYRLGRELGGPRVGALAALLGPIVASRLPFGLEPRSFFAVGLYAQLWGTALLPHVLVAVIRAVRGTGAVTAAAAWCATLLITHVMSAQIALVLSLPLLLGPMPAPRVRLARFAAVWALAALAGAGFWLPLVLGMDSFGGWPWESAALRDGLPVQTFLSHLVHGVLFDRPHWPVVTPLCAVGLFCLARRLQVGPGDRRFLLAALALATLAVLGRATFGGLVDLVPLWSNLPFGRFGPALELAGALVAAVGAAWVLAWVSARLGRAGRPVAVALIGIIVVTNVHRGVVTFQRARTVPLDDDRHWRAAMTGLRAMPPGRLWVGAATGFPGHLHIHLPSLLADKPPVVSLAVGYQDSLGTFHATQAVLQRDAELMGARYALAAPGVAVPGRLVAGSGPYRIYELAGSGYLAVVDVDGELSGSWASVRERALAWMRSDRPAQRRHLRIELTEGEAALSPAEIDAPPPDRGPPGEVLSEAVGSTRFSGRVHASRPAWVLLRVAHHPGWRAWVDGVERDTHMLTPAMVGVRVPPGEHDVHFEFRRPWWHLLVWLVGLAGLAAAMVIERRRGRPVA